MGQHIPQDPAGNGTVQAGAVGSPIRLGKHTCLIRVRKPPLRIIVWETLLIQSAVQIHDVLGFISQGVPPILISIFKRANFSLFGTILKIVNFERFFGFQRGHPTKWTFPCFHHEISSGVCFPRYHVAWSNMSQVMCTMPILGAGIEWCDASAGPKGQSTNLSLKSFLYFLMGTDCASTRGIFRKHSNGMNLICSIFIHGCRCCRSNPCDITQSGQRSNLHNSQVMVRSEARNGLRMMPRQHGARKTQHRSEGFWHFFWTQPFWTI